MHELIDFLNSHNFYIKVKLNNGFCVVEYPKHIFNNAHKLIAVYSTKDKNEIHVYFSYPDIPEQNYNILVSCPSYATKLYINYDILLKANERRLTLNSVKFFDKEDNEISLQDFCDNLIIEMDEKDVDLEQELIDNIDDVLRGNYVSDKIKDGIVVLQKLLMSGGIK